MVQVFCKIPFDGPHTIARTSRYFKSNACHIIPHTYECPHTVQYNFNLNSVHSWTLFHSFAVCCNEWSVLVSQSSDIICMEDQLRCVISEHHNTWHIWFAMICTVSTVRAVIFNCGHLWELGQIDSKSSWLLECTTHCVAHCVLYMALLQFAHTIKTGKFTVRTAKVAGQCGGRAV